MAKKILTLVRLAALLLVAVSGVGAQTQNDDDEVISIETTLVSVPVIVSDRQGRYTGGLERKDFTLYQDGIEQKIDFFAATEEPLNIALLIDTSLSTRAVLDDIKDAGADFIERLQPQDKAMVIGFDYTTHVLSPLTSDRRALQRAVKDAEIGARYGTTLREAIIEVVGKSFAGIKGRKAIILLTDGKDFGSDISTRDLIYSIEESDTLIYSVFYRTGRAFRAGNNRGGIFGGRGRRGGNRRGGIFGGRFPNGGGDGGDQFPTQRVPDAGQRSERVARANEEAVEFLQQLADATAGRFYRSEVTDLKQTFGLIVEELRYQYRIGFYPQQGKKDGALHELKVKVARPGTIVRARRNYRAGQPSTSSPTP